MRSSCGRLVLTYNGEIYNCSDLRPELEASGRAFRGHSDSEVLVEACAHWGVAQTLKRLNGMFAFAVWDRKTRTLYLARDRVGIKPLYWARFGTLFLFGSELKALRAHDGWVPQIDRQSLRAYMRRGHMPAPYSMPHAGIVSDGMERMGYFDFLTLLVDGILTKVDRASMAHSLEVRVPLLDHRVVEYAWSLPPIFKYGRKSESKRLLRRLLYQYVPRDLVDRPKKGFASPLAIWLRGPLRGWADELLDERQIRENGFFDSARVRACWNDHLRGTSDHWRLLWGILMFEQWRRHWAIAPAVDPDVRVHRPRVAEQAEIEAERHLA